MAENPTIGMYVGMKEVERRLYGRRCQHGLPVADPCDECAALAEFEERLAADRRGIDNDD